jgi:hypothetical protein
MTFRDKLTQNILEADKRMREALVNFRCTWCGHPTREPFCSPECLDADWQAYLEETLESHQLPGFWEE